MQFSLSRIFSSRQASPAARAAEGKSTPKLQPKSSAEVGRHGLVSANVGGAQATAWRATASARSTGESGVSVGLQYRLQHAHGAAITSAAKPAGDAGGARPSQAWVAGAQQRSRELGTRYAVAFEAAPNKVKLDAAFEAMNRHGGDFKGGDMQAIATLGKQLAVRTALQDMRASENPEQVGGSVHERLVDGNASALRLRELMIANGLPPQEAHDRMNQAAQTMAGGGQVDLVSLIPRQKAMAVPVETAQAVTELPDGEIHPGEAVRVDPVVIGWQRAQPGAERAGAPRGNLGHEVSMMGFDAAIAEIERLQAPPEAAIPAGRSARVDEAIAELGREPDAAATQWPADGVLHRMAIDTAPATAMFDDALAELAGKTT